MGTRQTLDVLASYASLLRDCGDSRGADAMHALASALSSAEDAKIKATVTKVTKVWANSPEMVASPCGLGKQLQALRNLLLTGGAKATSTDIGLLVQLLEGRQAVDPREFERVLRSAILALPPQKKAARAPKREPLPVAEVRKWADRLTATSTDQDAFETVLEQIQQIPKLTVAELSAIAEHYLGHEAPKGKPGILKKLRSRQMQDAIEAGRQSRIQRIAV